MYSKLPHIVFGFHGCDATTLDKVIHCNEPMMPSTNDYDWLGKGIYFWEQNLERALEWANEQCKYGKFDEPAVIGAAIDLGHCLNLTDSKYIDLISNEFQQLATEYKNLKLTMPKNSGKDESKPLRRLDCAVIEHLHTRIENSEFISFSPFDSARGLFSEGNPIYPGAGFKEKTHVQICVRNPNCIKALFEPRHISDGWICP